VVNVPVQACSPHISCVHAYTMELWVFSTLGLGFGSLHSPSVRFSRGGYSHWKHSVWVVWPYSLHGSLSHGFGALKKCHLFCGAKKNMEWIDGGLLICTIDRAFLLEKVWEWSAGEHA